MYLKTKLIVMLFFQIGLKILVARMKKTAVTKKIN